MLNQLILDNFKKLIELIKIQSINSTDQKEITINQFRIASLKKALKIISNHNKKILNGNDLKDIQGIGKGTIDRINEILQTKTLYELKDYLKIINRSTTRENIIVDLMKVVGIGRITANHLISTYNIKSAKELKQLSDTDQIQLNDKIKVGLKYFR